MDHDTISGAEEFIEAGTITGLATTIGVECRADFSGTSLKGKRINNPDQNTVAYVALHGIPHTQIQKVSRFFAPYIKERNLRNQKMVEKLNEILDLCGIRLDYHSDIEPLSMSNSGGSITERHILFSLSLKLVEKLGKGLPLLNFLRNDLHITVSEKQEKLLSDSSNTFYEYDLLGLLKSELVASFYIDATAECPDIRKVIDFTKSIGAISAYAYLGDVGDSATGDKKAQKFEDDYIDQLFEVLKELGFNAVTYMPSRNSTLQLERLRSLCEKYQLFQISGEDINSPRQSFVCEAMRVSGFQNLIDSTWALIGHEMEATKSMEAGMFSAGILKRYPELNDRTIVFKKAGLRYLIRNQ
jgi:hypothetical protein